MDIYVPVTTIFNATSRAEGFSRNTRVFGFLNYCPGAWKLKKIIQNLSLRTL